MNNGLNLAENGSLADINCINEFINASAWLSNQMLALGLPARDPKFNWASELLALSALNNEKKSEIIGRIKFYADVCANANSNGFAGLNDSRVTWYALKKLGLAPPSDLFEQIMNTDCVEIYDSLGIQMFRNFNFCQHVTYSIQECLIFPWDQLYERSENIIGTMMSEAQRALGAKHPFHSQIPVHTCVEIKTSKKRQYRVKFKLISPLFDPSGNAAAFLVTSNLDVLRDIGADNSIELR